MINKQSLSPLTRYVYIYKGNQQESPSQALPLKPTREGGFPAYMKRGYKGDGSRM